MHLNLYIQRANICRLLLIDAIEVISSTVQTYRSMRDKAMVRVDRRYSEKNANVTEDEFNADIMNSKKNSIAFEYLLERKEHPALTYKLGDVS